MLSIFPLFFFCAYCRASSDLGIRSTSGENNYRATDFSFSTDLSKKTNLSLQYSSYQSYVSTESRSIYAGLSFDLGKNFFAGITYSFSPETDNYRTNSAGINANYGFSFDGKASSESNWWLQLGMDLGSTNHSQRFYSAQLRRFIWPTLSQKSNITSVYLTLFKLTTVSASSTKYNYDKDLKNLEQNLYLVSSINPSLTNTLYMVQGFPGTSTTIGIEQNFWDYFTLSLSKTRINYLLYLDYSNSAMAEISTYYIQPFKFKLGFNTDEPNTENKSTYTSIGVTYYF